MAGRNNNAGIFREKSIERVSSPENLDKYIRSTSPSLWLMLASIILILVGILAFSIFGKIESSSVVGCKVEDGYLTSYISENDYSKIKEDSYIEINGIAYTITRVTGPFVCGDDSDSFLSSAANLENGSWYYELSENIDLADGKYKGKAVFEKISPITFIIN